MQSFSTPVLRSVAALRFVTATIAPDLPLSKIKTSPGRDWKVVARTHTLELLDGEMSASDISRRIGFSRTSVYAVAHRCRAGGLNRAIPDGRRTGPRRAIS